MKLQFVKIASSLLALSIVLSSCDPFGIKGTGAIVSETRDVDDFDRVSIGVPGKARLHVGNEFRVDIQVESSLAPYIETEVRNGRLDIYFSRNVFDVDGLEVDITAPDFRGIDISGSTALIMQDSLAGNNLDLDISGSGSMLLSHVNFATIHTNTSGSGEMTIRGVADHLDANISGSGEVDALDCPVLTADLTISGSGSIRCFVTDLLKGNISGSGCIYYKGTPALDISTSGSGKVKKID